METYFIMFKPFSEKPAADVPFAYLAPTVVLPKHI